MDFKLRKWTLDDIDDFFINVNDKEITDNLSDLYPFPYNYQNASNSVSLFANADESQMLVRAIDINGKAVGSIGVTINSGVYRKSGDIGYWIGKEYWSKGIMTKAVKQICETAFNTYDIIRISAEVLSHNTGSIKVLEKAGFKQEGLKKKNFYKNGILYDSYMYALIR
ncbi:GNAT family N-acetyltransferase [Ruminiclostridium josui]|uniref:GNAT family N-acetyltransferase n=1 Tax=Ruminiclostridium josui TaxID=1499 RepID=UPI000464A88C|nr:GNAT family protein [Ruminiclostridium josui]